MERGLLWFKTSHPQAKKQRQGPAAWCRFFHHEWAGSTRPVPAGSFYSIFKKGLNFTPQLLGRPKKNGDSSHQPECQAKDAKRHVPVASLVKLRFPLRWRIRSLQSNEWVGWGQGGDSSHTISHIFRDSYGLPGVGVGNSIGKGSHYWGCLKIPLMMGGKWKCLHNSSLNGMKISNCKTPKTTPKSHKTHGFLFQLCFFSEFPISKLPTNQPTNQPKITASLDFPICGSPTTLVFVRIPASHPSGMTPPIPVSRCALQFSVEMFFEATGLGARGNFSLQLGNPPTNKFKGIPPPGLALWPCLNKGGCCFTRWAPTSYK